MDKQTMTLRDLRAAAPTLQKLLSADLPPRLAYLLAKAIRAINTELETIESVRAGLIKRLGEEQTDGSWQVTADKTAEFQAAWDELLDTETTLGIAPVPIRLFPDSLHMSPAEMLALLFLLEE